MLQVLLTLIIVPLRLAYVHDHPVANGDTSLFLENRVLIVRSRAFEPYSPDASRTREALDSTPASPELAFALPTVA